MTNVKLETLAKEITKVNWWFHQIKAGKTQWFAQICNLINEIWYCPHLSTKFTCDTIMFKTVYNLRRTETQQKEQRTNMK